ncbi:MAG: glycosyltransferase family 2 protein, partial [Sphingomonas sp.]
MISLAQTLVVESPRHTPRRIPFASRMIGAVGPVLFLALLVQAFLRQGVAVWSIGIAYILYDTALLVFTAWNIRGLRHAPVASATTPTPSFGVIVAAHNEAPVIAAAIDRLAGQAESPDLILIADDGSSDATAEVLSRRYALAVPALGDITERSSVLPSLRWLRLPHGGKARALNDAMLQIDTTVVLTVDADTLLEPGAIAAMRAAFAAEPELVAATGVLAPICGPDVQGRLFQWFQSYEYVRNFLSRHAWEQLGSLLLISGAFAAFRRDAVVAVGGFDPDCMVEDYELIHRLHRHAVDNGYD